MRSIWNSTSSLPDFPPLEGDRSTQILVIGGGMAGLLTLYLLKQAGADCLLVEADRLCAGVTQNTTAKLTVQHGLIYDRLIRQLGPDRAGRYLRANREALDQYRTLCRDIDCDFEEEDSFVYALGRPDKLRRELDALKRLGQPARLVSRLPIPIETQAVAVPGQGQFHPLKFAAHIARGLPVCEHTKVRELMPGQAMTDRGRIRAEHIVVATHFPLLNKHGGYSLKLYQHRSYVLALRDTPEFSGMYVDEAERGLSFRRCGDLLLLGGGSHRTGKQGGGWAELAQFAREHYPGAREVARWATQDCMTLDGVPYAGRYARGTDGLYVATGFNKWGMTSSMAAARLLTDLLSGQESPYADLFSPARSVLRPQLAVNLLESALGLLTPTVPRCPHLGCALKYNPAEHSWDCPCHGSRFTGDGRLINGPATDDKRP